jgi:tetratricopeptide (TPR) repeat protein
MRSIGQSLLAVALLGTVFAVPAFAQPSNYPPPCDASKVSKGDVDRAHAVYLSGRQFLAESNYDKAISYFNDAYSIDCSVHGILPAIATAYERKGDKAEAVRALEEYLRRAPNAADREQVERRIKNLNDLIAREAPPPSAASASSAPAASAAPSASSLPAPSATPAPATPTTMQPPAPEPPPGKSSAGPWVLGGIGGAAIIGGVVMYVVGSSDISSALSVCPSRSGCPASAASQGNEGRTLKTAGAIVGGVGLGAVAAGLIWFLAEKPAASPAAGVGGAAGAVGAPFLSPVLAPGYAGVEVRSAL